MASQDTSAPFNPQLIVPFVKSVRGVLQTMAGTEIETGRPHVKENPSASYDVSAIIQFGGDITGSVVVSFELDAAKAIIERFAGMELEADSSDFVDAIGELGNMIAGAAKPDLGYEATIGIPNVILGKGHVVARLKEVPTLVVPCEVESFGKIAVEVGIRTVAGAIRKAA
jgi:chemotaxis protein CheX